MLPLSTERTNSSTTPDRAIAHIRAQLVNVLSRPSSVDIRIQDNAIVLSGLIFENELEHVLRVVRKSAEGRQVRYSFELLKLKLGVKPEHQGENRFGYQEGFILGAWPSWVRAVAGASGSLLLAISLRRRTVWDILSSTLGLALLSRALTNLDITQLLGSLILPVLRMRRTIQISAPVEDVYEFWSHFENYPRFMSYIEEVKINELGGLHWTARGPGGMRLDWDTQVGALQPNRKVAWKSVPGSLIATEGIVQMSETDFGTRLQVELSYAPPVGAIGYVAAHTLGFDPRGKIDQDLEVMRILIEKAARDVHRTGNMRSVRTPL